MRNSANPIWNGWEQQKEAAREVELLRAAREGELSASEELFVRYLKGSSSIRSLLRKGLSNPADREEMLHEIFMALVAGNNTFRGEARLSTYIYQVARITIFQKYRRENALKRRQLAQTLHEGAEPADPIESSPEAAYVQKENRRILACMIQNLPGTYREAVRLRILDELTYEEIAHQMHLPVNTVSTKIHKGKKLLAASRVNRKCSEWKDRRGYEQCIYG